MFFMILIPDDIKRKKIIVLNFIYKFLYIKTC